MFSMSESVSFPIKPFDEDPPGPTSQSDKYIIREYLNQLVAAVNTLSEKIDTLSLLNRVDVLEKKLAGLTPCPDPDSPPEEPTGEDDDDGGGEPALPELALSNNTLAFSGDEGGSPNPANDKVQAFNAKFGTLATPTTSVSDPSGIIASVNVVDTGSQTWDIVVTPQVGALSAGTYNATVFVQTTNGGTKSLFVSLTVIDVPDPPPPPPPPPPVDLELVASPTSLSFSATEGDPDPADKIVSLSKSGTGTLNTPTVQSVSDPDDIIDTQIVSTGPQTWELIVSPKLGSLAPATYNATVTLVSSNQTNSPVVINVSLQIAPAAVTGPFTSPLNTLPVWASYSPVTDRISGEPYASPDLSTYFTGTVRQVTTRAQLTSALSASVDRDVIEIPAGTTIDFSSIETFPKRADNGWVLIRSDEWNQLPAAGTRVGPGDDTHMAHLRTTGTNPIYRFAQGARGYLFLGIKHSCAPALSSGRELVDAGASTQSQLAHIPSFIEWQRCRFVNPYTGPGTSYCRRGIDVRCHHFKILDCDFFEFVEAGVDNQAIAIANTTGFGLIRNNRLAANCENIFIGGGRINSVGADVAVNGDIIVRQNYILRSAAQMADTTPTVANNQKNFVESKHCERVVFEGNVCENFNGSAQDFCMAWGAKPQTQSEQGLVFVKDVLARYNLFLNAAAPTQVFTAASDPPNLFRTIDGTQRVEICHNLWHGNATGNYNDRVQFHAPYGGPNNSFHHNTFHCTNMALSLTGPSIGGDGKHPGLKFSDNICYAQPSFGPIFRSGGQTNDTALDNACGVGQWECKCNIVVVRSWGSVLLNAPHNNKVAASLAAIDFVDAANGDYTLSGSSPYKGTASDGGDPGVNMSRLNDLIAGVVSGMPDPTA